MAPYVNSYRRLSRHTAAPINIEWGHDNRTVGIRSPIASPEARRIENRVIGADANPYVAMAMTLACGYLGMKNKIKPKPEMKGDANLSPYALPRSLGEALDWLRREPDLHDVLGKEFVTIYVCFIRIPLAKKCNRMGRILSYNPMKQKRNERATIVSLTHSAPRRSPPPCPRPRCRDYPSACA